MSKLTNESDMSVAFDEWMKRRGPLGAGAVPERIFFAGFSAGRRATPSSEGEADADVAKDAARWRFSMQFQGDGTSKEQPEAIINMWRKVYAEGRLRPTRAEYEAATDAAIAEVAAMSASHTEGDHA